ncbi:putative acyltransferase [Burkholderiales bacterium JOSHI_001]|nr:putative acyltransferase [Burkholderiales bacterium JOSHI_001]
MHPLDQPVWPSLNSHHAPLSEGGALARRFLPDVNLFGASVDDSAPALDALAALLPARQPLLLLQARPVVLPPGLVAVKQALCVQMVATGPVAVPDESHIQVLTDADAPEMLALARLTEPGPFLERTHTMGRFLGVRIDGRLAAMAGERLRWSGFTEVSGVCTHPDFRGRGLAGRLSAAVAANIQARGDQPFLHAWATNAPAISLYRALGFQIRGEMNAAVLERSPA